MTAGPLTSKERGQWFLHQVAGRTGIGNLAVSYRFPDRLRWWPAQEALRLLGARHAALRQTFVSVGGTPTRRVAAPDAFEIPLDIVGAGTDSVPAFDELVAGLTERPFDLAAGPLVRATHVRLPGGSALVVVAHHIVVDWLSLGILAEDFTRDYTRLAGGDGAELPAVVPSFHEPRPDAASVRDCVENLAGADSAGMSLDGARPVSGSPRFSCGMAAVRLTDRGPLAGLRGEMRVSDSVVMLAASAALLHRHGAGADLVLGVPVNVRPATAIRAVGFHVSTVPVRVRFGPGTTFRDLVAQARAAMRDILAGRVVSFEDVLEHAGHRSADWRAPLFRHVVNLLPVARGTPSDGGGVRVHRIGCRTDLELTAELGTTEVTLRGWFGSEIHDHDEIQAMLRRFAPLVAAAHATPDRPVADLDITSPEDRRLLDDVNATATAVDEATLLDRIHAAARTWPDHTAIVHGTTTWSYRHLLAGAERVARQLERLGVTPGRRVGVVGHRGAELAAAVLGVWSVGAAYVPVDPTLPAALAQAYLDGAAGLLVPAGAAPEVAVPVAVPVVVDVAELLARPPDTAPGRPRGARAEEPAVVIHTSGTTGRPKGVVVGHRAMVNVVGDLAARLAVEPSDRVLWSTTFGFDVSALELLMPLVSGATVVVADDEVRRRPSALLDLVTQRRVGVVQATPTLWRELAPVAAGRLTGVRAISGGEPLTAALAEQILATGCAVFNAYGPTEATIWSTLATVTAPVSEPVTIGRPIANTTVEIRDEAGRRCPPGVVGELWIGGTGLAEGYLDQPELTGLRFVGEGTARRYRTGDLARWRADGSLVLHGRADRQVKLRGHRIELGSVEAVIERHAGVAAAAVCLTEGPHGDDLLAAFVRPAREDDPGDLVDAVWRHARDRLPPHEVPNRIVPVADFPLTRNGKVDHLGLAGLLPTTPVTEPPPADPLVRELIELWRGLLGLPGLGADANFFLNGGHSLRAAELLREIDRLGHRVDHETLFAAPTPALLGKRLRERTED